MNKIGCRQNHTIDKTEYLLISRLLMSSTPMDDCYISIMMMMLLNVDHRNQITTDFTMNRNDSFVHI